MLLPPILGQVRRCPASHPRSRQCSFLFAAGLSFAAALLLIVAGSVLSRSCASRWGRPRRGQGWARLLLSPAIPGVTLQPTAEPADPAQPAVLLLPRHGSVRIQTFTLVGMGAALHGTRRPGRRAPLLCRFLLCGAGGAPRWAASSLTARRTMERVAAVALSHRRHGDPMACGTCRPRS